MILEVCLRVVELTNLAYVEPHRVIIMAKINKKIIVVIVLILMIGVIIDGNIISFNSISVRVQLNDRKFTSYDEILHYCQQVKNQYEEVKYVMPEMIETTTVN